jgi:hypothetical protein
MLFLLSFEALLCARVNIVLSEVEAEVPTGEVVASSASLSRINLSRYKMQRSFLCLGWQVYGEDTA